MRLYLKISKSRAVLPFSYQHLLTGVIHKWLGKDNAIHGKSAQYSFSWIQNAQASQSGVTLTDRSYFFISAYDVSIIKQLIKGILADPTMFLDISVEDVQMTPVPEFNSQHVFAMASPVLLKVKDGNTTYHVTLKDSNFESVLTQNLKNKLERHCLSSEGVAIKLDPSASYKKTKLVTYNGIQNKTSFAPIIIEGTPKQIAFAWCLGLGNSTGIGFGALK